MSNMWDYRTRRGPRAMTWSGTASRQPTAPSARSTRPATTPRRPTWWWTPVPGSSARSGSSPLERSRPSTTTTTPCIVTMTKDQIKGAPDYDENDLDDDAYLKHGDYYRSSGFIPHSDQHPERTAARTRPGASRPPFPRLACSLGAMPGEGSSLVWRPLGYRRVMEAMKPRMRLAIVDDYPVVVAGVASFLAAEHIDVVETGALASVLVTSTSSCTTPSLRSTARASSSRTSSATAVARRWWSTAGTLIRG